MTRLGPIEKYFFTGTMLIMVLLLAGLAASIVYAVATHLAIAGLVLLGFAAFVGVVHIIVKKVDWSKV